MRRPLIAVAVLAIAGGAGFAWWYMHRAPVSDEVVLYGNIDLRQVEVAFTDSGRIVDVLAEEGDQVIAGQVLARLDTRRLMPQIDQVKAQIAAQTAAVEKLRNGSRPEEIEQARANVAAATADADNAEVSYERLQMLTSSGGNAIVTASQLDAAKAAYDAAQARLNGAEKALELVIAGPRQEDVAQAQAQLRGIEAQLALLEQQLDDADLTAPVDGIVRSRLMEPGEIASPQRPVFSLAIVDPKWVRAYVSETNLTRVQPGMTATVIVDGTGNTRFTGRVGFISPVAEFTPRTIQTEELRTSLVYEVRVFVTDPGNLLRLGMPATVNLPLPMPSATASAAPGQ